MTTDKCPRAWEVEAAHDGRLSGEELQNHALHLTHCARCAAEQRALQKFGQDLRALPSDDELVLRRIRRTVLSRVHGTAVGSGRTTARSARWAFGAALLSAALIAATWLGRGLPVTPGQPVPTAASLRLTPEPGARYAHRERDGLEVVELREGTLAIDFDRRSAADLLVRVPDGEIRDLGTTFRVVVAAERTEEISVQRGAVIFRRANMPDITIAAGHVFIRPTDERSSPDRTAAATASQSDSTPAAESAAAKKHARHRSTPATRTAATPTLDEHATSEEQDLAYLRILALLKESRGAEARVAAQEYLSRFPNGFRRTEVSRIASATGP